MCVSGLRCSAERSPSDALSAREQKWLAEDQDKAQAEGEGEEEQEAEDEEAEAEAGAEGEVEGEGEGEGEEGKEGKGKGKAKGKRKANAKPKVSRHLRSCVFCPALSFCCSLYARRQRRPSVKSAGRANVKFVCTASASKKVPVPVLVLVPAVPIAAPIRRVA